jgi:hypothetical protein
LCNLSSWKKKHRNRLSLNAKLHTTKNEVQWDMGETVVPGDSFQSLQSVACWVFPPWFTVRQLVFPQISQQLYCLLT